jgi:Ca-activated chloride channel family protein
MIRGLSVLLFVVSALQPQPTFRARTDLVRLDALVTDAGVPVTGLTAADFDVRDNGVPQRVTSLGAIEAVQLGVVLDASGSMTGERLEIVRGATADLLRQLETGDSVAIVGFGSQVGRLAARGADVERASQALARLVAAGSTSLVDGLYAGLIEADGGPGPKLLLLMTDGRNNSSWLKASDVIDVARRREAVVYPVAVGGIDRPGARVALPDSPRGTPDAAREDRDWRASTHAEFRTGDSMALLRVIARETGGRPIEASWDTPLGAVFRRILEEYRQRYVLTFTPEGVKSGDGWHTLEVRLKRRGLTVRSRTRYWSGP